MEYDNLWNRNIYKRKDGRWDGRYFKEYEQNVKINVRYTGTNEMIVASAISIISAMIIVISEIILNMKNLKLKRGIKIYLVLILFKTKACHFMYFIVKYIM